MDISFKTEAGRFNYRVCGVIIRQDCLLIMRDDVCPYFYLPGGRVQMHESADAAILREIQEETGFALSIVRPLWMGQAYFVEESSQERFHEICIYYLLDGSALPDKSFFHREESHANHFEWVSFRDLSERYFYPEFIKERIFHLPEHLEILIENSI